jgi:hypothetical protein
MFRTRRKVAARDRFKGSIFAEKFGSRLAVKKFFEALREKAQNMDGD